MKKKYFDKNLTKEELRKKICSFARSQGVNRVIFQNRARYVFGTYNYKNRNIYISSRLTKKNMLLVFMHELAHHCAAVFEKKWILYHLDAATPLLSPEIKFEIEHNIDRMAKKMWNEYVCLKTWKNYRFTYSAARRRELTRWFKDYF